MQKNAFTNHGIPNIQDGRVQQTLWRGCVGSPGLPVMSPLTDKVHTALWPWTETGPWESFMNRQVYHRWDVTFKRVPKHSGNPIPLSQGLQTGKLSPSSRMHGFRRMQRATKVVSWISKKALTLKTLLFLFICLYLKSSSPKPPTVSLTTLMTSLGNIWGRFIYLHNFLSSSSVFIWRHDPLLPSFCPSQMLSNCRT